MKRISVAAAVTLAVLLLSILELWGRDPRALQYDDALLTLSRFDMAESQLQLDVLNARAGLLRNYDSINQAEDRLHEALARLSQQGADQAALQPLAAMIAQQDALTEEFKTDNALLQNSLTYFGFLSGRFGSTAEDGPATSAMTGLTTAILHLTLDVSAASRAQVDEALHRVAELTPPSGEGLMQGLLRHGQALRDLLPETDWLLSALHDLPGAQREADIRVTILRHRKAAKADADHSRLLLYVASLLLVLLLLQFARMLRHRAAILRRRVIFERVIASISMGFVRAGSDETGARVEQALAELARWVGADRAYFIVSGKPFHAYAWGREGTTWPSEWPRQASHLVARLANRAQHACYVPAVATLPSGPDRDVLTQAGLLGWACVPATAQGSDGNLLGFDILRGPPVLQAEELRLLHMAVNTIANAVGRARLEGERVRLEASLEQGRRMEMVGRLASGVAHNFNNIIGAIRGYAEMEESQAAQARRSTCNLEGIRVAANRARDLVDQILTFGRSRGAPYQPVNLQSLLCETAALLTAAWPSGAHLRVGAVPPNATICGDFAQLQQVVINLCNNAAQAMDHYGTVDLTADEDDLGQRRRFSHGQIVPGRYVRIAVRDAGCGIDAATLERLFEPFFTTRVAGNGLGLATAYEIVRAHGGAMNVISQVGEGSLFELWLPEDQDVQDRPRADDQWSGRGQGETIMILDEDHERLMGVEDIVAALGYEPVGFVEPDNALAACRAMPQRFDAMLISHVMPATRGLAVIAALGAVAPMTPILLAMMADESDAEALARAGVGEVVSKPINSTELAAALSRCISPQRFRLDHLERQ
jgi:signal transduction histidine kinase